MIPARWTSIRIAVSPTAVHGFGRVQCVGSLPNTR